MVHTMDKYNGESFRPGWVQVLLGVAEHLFSLYLSDLLFSVLASCSSSVLVV